MISQNIVATNLLQILSLPNGQEDSSLIGANLRATTRPRIPLPLGPEFCV